MELSYEYLEWLSVYINNLFLFSYFICNFKFSFKYFDHIPVHIDFICRGVNTIWLDSISGTYWVLKQLFFLFSLLFCFLVFLIECALQWQKTASWESWEIMKIGI